VKNKWLCLVMSVTVIAGFASAMSIAVASKSYAANPDVSGNNSITAYVGTGGLLLPDSFSGPASKKTAVANCLGCTWKYTVYCSHGSDSPCKHAVTSCPRGTLRYRVWFGTSPELLTVIGSVCWGSYTPVTRRNVENRIDDYVIRYLPALSPGFDPPGGSLTSVPVIFWTGQPTVFRPPKFSLSGHTVAITARPSWRWTWGDGKAAWKSVAGAQYPSKQITHQYRSPGTYRVGVTTVWEAEYTVSGLGTFEASGEVIRQSKSLMVPIKSARTVLVEH
jgi:hypothetical protein